MLQEEGLSAAAFVKQRRNLLIVSLSQSTAILMDLNLGTPVSIFGNTISIGNPSAFSFLLWALWLYFLLRYIAFHAQYQPSSEYVWPYFLGQKESYLRSAAIRALEIEYPGVRAKNLETTFLNWSRQDTMQAKAQVAVFEEPNHPGKTIIVDVKLRAIVLAGVTALIKTTFAYAPTSEYFFPYAVAIMPVVLWSAKHL